MFIFEVIEVDMFLSLSCNSKEIGFAFHPMEEFDLIEM